MAGNKRELILDLLARDKTGPATKKAADNLEDVGDAADKAGRSTEKFGKQTEAAEDATEAFGNAATSAKRDVAALDRQIDGLNRELVELHRKYAHAADEMERRDLAKGIRKADAEIRRLGKSRGVLAGLIPDDSAAGATLGAGITSGLSSALSSASMASGLSAPVIGALAAGIAAGAPVLAGAISAAVTAGIASAGIGAGIALAVKGDASIRVAGADVGKRFMDGMQAAAARSFQGPLLESLSVLDAFGKRATSRMARAFDALGPQLTPLTKKLSVAGDVITESLAGAAERSGPALDAMGDSIILLTNGVSSFIDTMAEGGPTAAANLRVIAGATSDLISATGTLLGWLNDLSKHEWLTGPLIPFLRKHYAETADETANLTGETGKLPPALDKVGVEAAEAAERVEKMRQAQEGLLAANRQLYGSEADVAGAIADTTSKIKENGKGLDLTTKKGRENQQALSTLAGTLRSNFDAYVKVNGAGHGAQEVLKRNREAFIKAATAAGMAASKARDLANKLLGIPEKITPVITLSTNGATKAQQVKRLLDGIHSKTVSVDVLVNASRLDKVNNTLSRMGGGRGLEARATGGPVRKGQPYVVGERRPELFVPESNGMILPSVPRGRPGGSGGGGAAPVINVYAHPTSSPADIGREVAKVLDAYYRNGGKRP